MGRTTSRTAVAFAIAGAALATAAAPAIADDRVCRGGIGPVAVDGDVRVPAGARCVFTRTRVEGNVAVGRGATLVARGAIVDGNVQAVRHRAVAVVGGAEARTG